MAELPHVVILGAGPAGLGAAYRLRSTGRARVTVLERGARVGGNAGTFRIGGHDVDFGSHRLHPACAPQILEDIRRFLGSDLVERPRHGRIRLRGRWVHFPLKPLDLLLHVDRRFLAGAAVDAAARLVRRATPGEDSFRAVLQARLGPTICESFYFPYARKIWGLEPEQIAAEQAQRRVAANSPGKLIRKALAQVPGLRAPGTGRFYYPRRGFGQISEAYAAAAQEAGATLLTGWTARQARAPATSAERWTITAAKSASPEAVRSDDEEKRIEADYVWSTVPLPLLARMVTPGAPQPVIEAASSLDFRAMLLIYLELPVDRFTEFDAHYFPGADVAITRLSEPKNYAARSEPVGSTVLCAELPCSPDDPYWSASDDELRRVVAADLEASGLPLPATPLGVHVRRLRHAYPIYTRGFAAPFQALDDWAAAVPNLLSFGRQGLFAHDNTHHALAMAYAAVDCLGAGAFDTVRWAQYRHEFEKHVVVD